jgi:hypothetical protein
VAEAETPVLTKAHYSSGSMRRDNNTVDRRVIDNLPGAGCEQGLAAANKLCHSNFEADDQAPGQLK